MSEIEKSLVPAGGREIEAAENQEVFPDEGVIGLDFSYLREDLIKDEQGQSPMKIGALSRLVQFAKSEGKKNLMIGDIRQKFKRDFAGILSMPNASSVMSTVDLDIHDILLLIGNDARLIKGFSLKIENDIFQNVCKKLLTFNIFALDKLLAKSSGAWQVEGNPSKKIDISQEEFEMALGTASETGKHVIAKLSDSFHVM